MLGLGIGITMAPMSTAAMNAVNVTKSGVASGLLAMSRMVGGSFGVAALGALVQHLAAGRLTDSGISAAQRDAIVHNLGSGGAARNLPAPVAQAARDAFVHAFSTGMWLCAGAALAGAVAAWTLIESTPASTACPPSSPRGSRKRRLEADDIRTSGVDHGPHEDNSRHRSHPGHGRRTRDRRQALVTALRRTLVLFGATAAIAVAAFAVAAATTHDDGSGTPEHTVRDFLVSAVAEHYGFQACSYMTARSARQVQAANPRGMSCEAVLSSYARLTLGGERVDSEAAVKALTYRLADEAGGRVRVTVSAYGESRTFVLRRGTPSELREFAAPPTTWRIESGVARLLAR